METSEGDATRQDSEAGERLAGFLLRRAETSGQPPGAPVTVAELHRVLIPYHEVRGPLGFATKGEYDLALLRMLRAQRVVRIAEPELVEAVERELSTPEPGLAFLKNFAASQLWIVPALAEGEGPEAAAGGAPPPGSPTGAEETGEGEREGEKPGGEEPGAAAPAVARGERCWECGEELPARPGHRFCPYCGADQAEPRCRECREALEVGWRFCPRCGLPVE